MREKRLTFYGHEKGGDMFFPEPENERSLQKITKLQLCLEHFYEAAAAGERDGEGEIDVIHYT